MPSGFPLLWTRADRPRCIPLRRVPVGWRILCPGATCRFVQSLSMMQVAFVVLLTSFLPAAPFHQLPFAFRAGLRTPTCQGLSWTRLPDGRLSHACTRGPQKGRAKNRLAGTHAGATGFPSRDTLDSLSLTLSSPHSRAPMPARLAPRDFSFRALHVPRQSEPYGSAELEATKALSLDSARRC